VAAIFFAFFMTLVVVIMFTSRAPTVVPFPRYSAFPTSKLPTGPIQVTADAIFVDDTSMSRQLLPASIVDKTAFNATDVIQQLVLGIILYQMPCLGMAHFGVRTPAVLLLLDDTMHHSGGAALNVSSSDSNMMEDWSFTTEDALAHFDATGDTLATFAANDPKVATKRFLLLLDPDIQRNGSSARKSTEIVHGCSPPEVVKSRSATVKVFTKLMKGTVSGFRHELLVSGMQAMCLQSHHEFVHSPETVCVNTYKAASSQTETPTKTGAGTETEGTTLTLSSSSL
jgi:hypothetical protein